MGSKPVQPIAEEWELEKPLCVAAVKGDGGKVRWKYEKARHLITNGVNFLTGRGR